MGTFSISIGIGDQERERWTTLDALVDTGASITSVPASVLHELGVEPLTRQSFQFGQGEVRLMDVGQTWVRIEGREVVTLVLFNEEGTLPLLGALALEGVFMWRRPGGQETHAGRRADGLTANRPGASSSESAGRTPAMSISLTTT